MTSEIEDFNRQDAIFQAVKAEVASDSHFADRVIAAVMQGQRKALEEANRRASQTDRAWLLTLCLFTGQTLTPKMKEMLESALVPILKREGAKCGAERDALRKIEGEGVET